MSSYFKRVFQRVTQRREAEEPGISTGRIPLPASLVEYLASTLHYHYVPTHEWYNPLNETDFYEAVEAYTFAEQRGLETQKYQLIYDLLDAFDHDQFERAQEIVPTVLMPEPFVYSAEKRKHSFDQPHSYGIHLNTDDDNIEFSGYWPLRDYKPDPIPPHAVRAMRILEQEYRIFPPLYAVAVKTWRNKRAKRESTSKLLFAVFGRHIVSIAEWGVTVDEQPTH